MSRKYIPKKQTYYSPYEFKCKFHDNCDTCPYPACTLDGYDPTRKQRLFNPPTFRWTAESAEKYNRLQQLKLPVIALANIFDCTVGTMTRIIQNGGNV